MSKRILLFPGQGSQYVGMGRAISEAFSPASHILDQSSEISGMDMRKLLFDGPEDVLKQTNNTQPALFIVSMMVMEYLKSRDISFDAVAGHSLGEYSALCAAGAFTFEEGLRLVRLRGRLMAKAGVVKPGTMAAVLGFPADKIEESLKEARRAGIVVSANFNSLSQVVISGEVAAVQKAQGLLLSAGAKKVIILPVSGAFHSPLMDFAVEGLSNELNTVVFKTPKVPVITNVDALPQHDPHLLKSSLIRQLVQPVRWVDCVNKAIELGCNQAFEVGAGKVLMGLVRGISRDLKVVPMESAADFEEYEQAN
jgi:[acyl-carrier-protein] S-malonyltransferase